MKNKKLIYVLLPLVILIWGTIFYKIFFSASPEEELAEGTINPQKIIAAASVADTFSIVASYRDPFLGNAVYSENTDNETPKPKMVPAPKIEQAVQWPAIIYGGMIKNQQSTRQLALVKINGKENILKAGEMVGTIELAKIYKDSIEVKMGKEKKVVKK